MMTTRRLRASVTDKITPMSEIPLTPPPTGMVNGIFNESSLYFPENPFSEPSNESRLNTSEPLLNEIPVSCGTCRVGNEKRIHADARLAKSMAVFLVVQSLVTVGATIVYVKLAFS